MAPTYLCRFPGSQVRRLMRAALFVWHMVLWHIRSSWPGLSRPSRFLHDGADTDDPGGMTETILIVAQSASPPKSQVRVEALQRRDALPAAERAAAAQTID